MSASAITIDLCTPFRSVSSLCSFQCALPAIQESVAKEVLQAWIQRKTHEVASEDPLYAYLRGKIDGSYMSVYMACWCRETSMLCWLNALYKPDYHGNEVWARMALHRALLGDYDRRALTVCNHRIPNATPYFKQLALGQTTEEIHTETLAAKKRRTDAAVDKKPQSGAETEAYVFQLMARHAELNEQL